ncbi:MAG TPA: metal ABC transporter permease [Lacipirellulaceae bacterium]|nr:metal ABC transporter permease [Lacipirellulaceae bacterium]
MSTAGVSVACALLSVFVVSRRWAFLGEGIGHSGFGGAGLAWMLAVVLPGVERDWLPYTLAIVASLLTAIGVGWLSRRGRVSGDVAIGIFLVAAIAVGFVGQSVYVHHRNAQPMSFDNLFFGQPGTIDTRFVIAAVFVTLAVAMVVFMLKKEIVAYCLDPELARTSGVRTGMIHYLLVALIALVIVIGVRVVGTLLISALLVLPGAAALMWTSRLNTSIALACILSAIGAFAGVLVHQAVPYLPAAPCVVLVMFVMFVVSFVVKQVR